MKTLLNVLLGVAFMAVALAGVVLFVLGVGGMMEESWRDPSSVLLAVAGLALVFGAAELAA